MAESNEQNRPGRAVESGEGFRAAFEQAAVFYERYVAARQHPEYVRQKKLHREKYEQ